MKVLTVVGNRPQFVKAAAVSTHLRESAEEVMVHTGQHYDRELSAVFFEELGLPEPEHRLEVGSGSHARQTGATMEGLEPLAIEEEPDAVLVYGDTNATLAGALVAAKLSIPVAHVEAGMRSFDLTMPEEVNRRVADRLAGLLLCPTEAAVANLRAEGIAERTVLVGDVMADVALRLGPVAERRSTVLERFGLERGGYLVATLHRAGTVDDPDNLRAAVEVLVAAAERHGPLVFPVHPRTASRLAEGGIGEELERREGVIVAEPLGYLDFSALVRGAGAVLTDSGGLQKEAFLAGVRCLTMRENTEWVETVELGGNTLVGLSRERALAALAEPAGRAPAPAPEVLPYGGGEAGSRCASELLDWVAGA